MGIDRSFDGHDLIAGDRLWIEASATPGVTISVGPRIGVDYAGPDWAARPWRFGIADHAALSRPFPPSTRSVATR
jgi:DNA-3-methyladenine glycosylase